MKALCWHGKNDVRIDTVPDPRMDRIESGEIAPSEIITHRAKLADAPGLYKKFRDKEDGCIKVVMTP